MRFDSIDSADVVRFICCGSSCNEDCCMMRVLGTCYDIKKAWNSDESARKSLVKVMRWRVVHGERTMQEAKDIGLRFGAEVV